MLTPTASNSGVSDEIRVATRTATPFGNASPGGFAPSSSNPVSDAGDAVPLWSAPPPPATERPRGTGATSGGDYRWYTTPAATSALTTSRTTSSPAIPSSTTPWPAPPTSSSPSCPRPTTTSRSSRASSHGGQSVYPGEVSRAPLTSRVTRDHSVRAGVQPLYKQAQRPVCSAGAHRSETRPSPSGLDSHGGRRFTPVPPDVGGPCGLPSAQLHGDGATLALGDNQGLGLSGRSSLPGPSPSGSTLTRPIRETRDAKPRLGLGIFEAFTKR